MDIPTTRETHAEAGGILAVGKTPDILCDLNFMTANRLITRFAQQYGYAQGLSGKAPGVYLWHVSSGLKYEWDDLKEAPVFVEWALQQDEVKKEIRKRKIKLA